MNKEYLNLNIQKIIDIDGNHWIRKCPQCNCDIKHNNYDGARKCYSKGRKCRKCGSWNKGLTKETSELVKKASINMAKNNYENLREINENGNKRWERNCPKCDKIIKHKSLISARSML